MRGVTIWNRGTVSSEQFPSHEAPADLALVTAYSAGDAPLDWGATEEWQAPERKVRPVLVALPGGGWEAL